VVKVVLAAFDRGGSIKQHPHNIHSDKRLQQGGSGSCRSGAQSGGQLHYNGRNHYIIIYLYFNCEMWLREGVTHFYEPHHVLNHILIFVGFETLFGKLS
jgi:hypothetical protein